MEKTTKNPSEEGYRKKQGLPLGKLALTFIVYKAHECLSSAVAHWVTAENALFCNTMCQCVCPPRSTPWPCSALLKDTHSCKASLLHDLASLLSAVHQNFSFWWLLPLPSLSLCRRACRHSQEHLLANGLFFLSSALGFVGWWCSPLLCVQDVVMGAQRNEGTLSWDITHSERLHRYTVLASASDAKAFPQCCLPIPFHIGYCPEALESESKLR